jgi:AP-4 complex subunit sigma-1
MGIKFVLLVNKQGQTRLAQYFSYLSIEERNTLVTKKKKVFILKNNKKKNQ